MEEETMKILRDRIGYIEMYPSVKSEILRTFLEDELDLRNIKTYI